MKQLWPKQFSKFLCLLPLFIVTELPKTFTQCSPAVQSSLVADIVRSTHELSITFSGVSDNDIYCKVSRNWQPYAINAVPRSRTRASKIHVASNITGKYYNLFQKYPSHDFYVILEPNEIIISQREQYDLGDLVVVYQNKVFRRIKQVLVEIPDPQAAYGYFNRAEVKSKPHISAICLQCSPKVIEFSKSIASLLDVEVLVKGSYLDYGGQPMLALVDRSSLKPNQIVWDYSPFWIGQDKMSFAKTPETRVVSKRWDSTSWREFQYPWDSRIWFGVGVTWLSAGLLFMLIALVLMKKRTFYYTGRKLLEVMAVIRFPLKKDSSTGKGAAVVLKTGLSIIFIGYVQILIKNHRHQIYAHTFDNWREFDPGFCKLQAEYRIMGPLELLYMLEAQYDRCRDKKKQTFPVTPIDRSDLDLCLQMLMAREKVACFGFKSMLEDYGFAGYAKIEKINPWELSSYLTLEYQVKVAAQVGCQGCASRLMKLNLLMEAGYYMKFDQTYEENRPKGPEQFRYNPGIMALNMYTVAGLFDALAVGLSICSVFFIVEKIFSYRKIFPSMSYKEPIALSVALMASFSVTVLESFDFAVDYWPNLSTKDYIPMYSLHISHLGQHFFSCMVLVLSTLIKANVDNRKLGVIFAYSDKLIWILVTLSWLGFAGTCWWYGQDLFNYRAFPALLVAILTPIN